MKGLVGNVLQISKHVLSIPFYLKDGGLYYGRLKIYFHPDMLWLSGQVFLESISRYSKDAVFQVII